MSTRVGWSTRVAIVVAAGVTALAAQIASGRSQTVNTIDPSARLSQDGRSLRVLKLLTLTTR